MLAAPITAEPWYSAGEARWQPLSQFQRVWMRKDPPVDEAYLYATHLLELAERQGVQVLNRPASLRAWNEKLGALQFPELMAPPWWPAMWSCCVNLPPPMERWCSSPSVGALVRGNPLQWRGSRARSPAGAGHAAAATASDDPGVFAPGQ